MTTKMLYNLSTKQDMRRNERQRAKDRIHKKRWQEQMRWWEDHIKQLVIDFYHKYPEAGAGAAEYMLFNNRHAAMEERVSKILRRPAYKTRREQFWQERRADMNDRIAEQLKVEGKDDEYINDMLRTIDDE